MRKLKKIRLYTFFFEYKGGTYIHQSEGHTLENALKVWAANLPIEKIDATNLSFQEDLFDGIEDVFANHGITPIHGVVNVWCCSFLFGDDSLGILTVTITDKMKK